VSRGRLLGLAAVLLVGAVLPPLIQAQIPESGYRVGELAPTIDVNDLDGNPVALDQWIGQTPVYLQFWATWCEQCEALLPTLREAAAVFEGRVKFIGINVAVNQSPRRVRKYLEEVDPPFMTLYDNLGVSVRAFNVPTTSWVVIIDGAGIIRYVGVGGEQDFMGVLDQVTAPEPANRLENP
jgi:thiol-disulfide isomerase/thioredoxin